MFGIGTWEFMLILILALIVLGPSKLPGIAKSLGRGYAEFKRASQELRDSISNEVDMSDFRESINDARRSLEADIPTRETYRRNEDSSFPVDDIKPSDFNKNDRNKIEGVLPGTLQTLENSRGRSFANSPASEDNIDPGIKPGKEKEREGLRKADASEQGMEEDNRQNE